MLRSALRRRTEVPAQRNRLLGWGTAFLLATGFGVLGFGLAVAVYPQVFGDGASGSQLGLLRPDSLATTGMGLFGTMIAARGFWRREKWAWLTLWFLPGFWAIHFAAGLPPGTDHVHQILFLALSLLGLLMPFRQFSLQRSSRDHGSNIAPNGK